MKCILWIGTEGEFEFSRNTQSWSCWHFYTTVLTPPSLEPTTSCTPVQHSTAKPKVQTQAQGQHYTPPSFLESLVFSLIRHHRLLPNQSPGQDKQTPLTIESTMLDHPRLLCFGVHMSQHFWHQMLWLHWVSNPQPLAHQSSILPQSQKSGLRLGGDTTQLPIQIYICHCAWK